MLPHWAGSAADESRKEKEEGRGGLMRATMGARVRCLFDFLKPVRHIRAQAHVQRQDVVSCGRTSSSRHRTHRLDISRQGRKCSILGFRASTRWACRSSRSRLAMVEQEREGRVGVNYAAGKATNTSKKQR